MSSTRSRIRAVGVLTLAGTPSYVLCFLWHICMAGHMQHGPYPPYQWISDLWWAACFVSVLVLALNLCAKRQLLFSVGSVVLILLRIAIGSLGGSGALLELPLLVTMDVYAILYLVRPDRYQQNGEPNVVPNGRPAAQPGNSDVTKGPPSVS